MSNYVLDRPPARNDFNDRADLPPVSRAPSPPKIYYAVMALRTSRTSDVFAQRMFREVFLRCSEHKTPQERDQIAVQAFKMSKELHSKGSVICGIYSYDVAQSVLQDAAISIAARKGTGRFDCDLRLGLTKI